MLSARENSKPNEFQSFYLAKTSQNRICGAANSLGVTDATICFNDGCIGKENVLQRLEVNREKFMVEGLKQVDAERIRKADKETQEQNKIPRVRQKLLKRKREECESERYCPGGLLGHKILLKWVFNF